MNTANVNKSDIKPDLDPKKEKYWFPFQLPGYKDPAVLGQRVFYKKFHDMPLNKKVVIHKVNDDGSQIALIGECVFAINEGGGFGHFRLRGLDNSEGWVSSGSVKKVFEILYYKTGDEEPKPVVYNFQT